MPKPSAKSAKLVDTWYFEYQGIPADAGGEDDQAAAPATVEPIKVPIQLKILKRHNLETAPPMAVHDVTFEVSCKNPEFRFVGPNVEALRARMWSELNTNFAIRWEDWFLVQIRRESIYDRGVGTGFTFSYKRIEKGIAWDGTLLMRERHGYGRQESITPWPEVFKDNQGNVIACIPVTPEHENGLEEFSRSIDALRRKLAEYLKPDVILQTLLAGTGNGLLPAPEMRSAGDSNQGDD